ncbi:Ribosomal RNA large subunit methyltransferase E [Zhongshania aliphaticivorans]|uniref:Ribosomal RNA large subunit methyltransferase E n=2 Tax=Zhongshania aliphaticivorans TaxID=1470434 RepID=A0A5S9N506_9GAMM|nr:Ribosomal RNA large subunit methyltransferase E [Zhongshania aliphaticivorans]CAA0084904.1 Ribosomal RNA large subunit methyltransferase E [Zhongshania aliphaticivorans]
MKEHFDDHYVKMAQRDGYRSRACYKLLEIQEKDRLIKPGMSVVDLGSAPGGWSQVAAMLVGHHGQILASDILEMDTIAGVEFIQGDFTEESVFNELMAFLGNQKADLVISDMAPNMSGMRDVDQPQSMYLCELALDMASSVLRPGGGFVTKIFQGEGFDQYMRLLREQFSKVVTRKPAASRPRSREVYLVATGLRG